MSQGRTAAGTAQRVGTGFARLARAWRVMPQERRLAALGAAGLFLTLFLPWYQETVIAPGAKNLQSASASLTGWGAFSFVEAAVLLVAAGVLTLLFQRAEGHAFHVPGGDGWVIMAAGSWTCVLVVWRIFDKQGTTSHGQYATASGIEWGIFVALGVAAFLAYAGARIRAAHSPEPPLPGEEEPRSPVPPRPADRRVRPPRPVRAAGERPRRPDEEATVRMAGEEATVRMPGEGDVTRVRARGESTRIRGREEPTGVRHDDEPTRVRGEEPPTMRLAPPSTPAARARQAAEADDQLTIPLEDDRPEA